MYIKKFRKLIRASSPKITGDISFGSTSMIQDLTDRTESERPIITFSSNTTSRIVRRDRNIRWTQNSRYAQHRVTLTIFNSSCKRIIYRTFFRFFPLRKFAKKTTAQMLAILIAVSRYCWLRRVLFASVGDDTPMRRTLDDEDVFGSEVGRFSGYVLFYDQSHLGECSF